MTCKLYENYYMMLCVHVCNSCNMALHVGKYGQYHPQARSNVAPSVITLGACLFISHNDIIASNLSYGASFSNG